MDVNKQTSGVISHGELYTLSEFKRRLGLTDTAMRELRRKGFVVLRVGKRAFVNGFLAIAFLSKEWVETDESESGQDPGSEVPSATLGMSADWSGEAEVGQDKRSA